MYLGKVVEVMDAHEIFSNPLHPYTKALLSAVPSTNYYLEKKRKRIILEGEVPSPINAPSGCSFHPRCKHRMNICVETIPQLKDVGNGHSVACNLYT
jgi:peptide/nickel transport system ATP-binding protein/oligopeptide transport system ATP-binding protein